MGQGQGITSGCLLFVTWALGTVVVRKGCICTIGLGDFDDDDDFVLSF